MYIFESLENLNVSEECFDNIISMVEGIMTQAIKNRDAARAYFRSDAAEPVAHAEHVMDKVSKMKNDTFRKTSSPNRGNMTKYTPKNVREFGDNRMSKAEAGRRLNKIRAIQKTQKDKVKVKRVGEPAKLHDSISPKERNEIVRVHKDKDRIRYDLGLD
jgi:DNA polymerase III delta prime subunit